VRLYAALHRRFGAQRWWPGRSPYEIAVGAVLTQHTAWGNAARAIAALRGRRLLTPSRLAALEVTGLARLIRPAGTPSVKARRLRALTRWILERVDGSLRPMRTLPLEPLRADLLATPGIGPETADAILLYSAGRPVFVADAYTRRVLARHRLVHPRAGYEEVRRWLEAHLPSDPELFNEFHALLVAVGKSSCRLRPRCEGCALRFDLHGRRPALQSTWLARARPTASRRLVIGRTRSAPRRSAPPRREPRASARARPSA
jgi:endonuclease-3 related protein